jgi:hypothetical protein
MNHTKFDILKSWFVRDKRAYWWKTFSDYELQLSRMSLTELASELNRTKVRNETENTIIIEHILAARLARLQSRASWWSGWLSFAGAMLAAALTFYLGQLSAISKNDTQVVPAASNKTEKRTIEKPVQSKVTTVEQKAPNEEAIKSHRNNSDAKQ